MISDNTSFRKGVVDSFKNIEGYEKLEENKGLVDTLIKLLDQETLTDFAHTLENGCSLSV